MKRKKRSGVSFDDISSNNTSNNLFSEDEFMTNKTKFFMKLKSSIKAVVILALLGGAVYAGFSYYQKNFSNKNEDDTTSLASLGGDERKLTVCLTNASKANSVPDASDGDFYPKVIAYYDAQLACYDMYPGIRDYSRTSIESAKQSALDASGEYEDTYIAAQSSKNKSGSSDTSSHVDSKTGCSYSLSESDFLSCIDAYNSSHPKNSKTYAYSNSSSTTNNNTSSNTSTKQIDTVWCDAQKATVSTLYSDYKSARDVVDSVTTKKANLSTAIGQKYPYLTSEQRKKEYDREYGELESQLSTANRNRDNALSKYNDANSTYNNKCQ